MGTVTIPEALVRAAMQEPALRGRVFLCGTRRVPLRHGRAVVGFVTPHETTLGWRAGPIYVTPGHRGHGHVEQWYQRHGDRTWVAFVADTNPASLAMHRRAGFTPWRRARGGQWLRREAQS